jgi:hypothetical protein
VIGYGDEPFPDRYPFSVLGYHMSGSEGRLFLNGRRAGLGGHKTPTVRSKNCFSSRTDRGRLSCGNVSLTVAFASWGPDLMVRPRSVCRLTAES